MLKAAIFLILLIFLPAFVLAQSGKPRPMRIGVIGPETGEQAVYGLKTLAGASVAVKEINSKGGILGKKIELFNYDDKNTKSGAVNAAIKLIEEHKVIGIIAAPTGWSSFGPLFAANDSKTLYITAGTRRKLGRSGNFVFRNSLPDNLAAEGTIAYCADKLGYKKYAIITAVENDFSLQLTAYFKKAVFDKKGVVVAEVFTGSGYSGYKDAVAEIKQKSKGQIDAIIYTGSSKEGAEIVEEAKNQGLNAPLIGGSDLMSPELWEVGKDSVVGTIVYNSFAIDSKSKEAAGFIELYKKEKGENPDATAALAYDAVVLLSEAIKKAKTTDTIKVREAMLSLKGFRGATGAMSFGFGGEPLKHPFVFRLEKKDSAYSFNLVDEK
jgi:branched-chain amino acid transport system substrate-binding protein